MTDNRTTELLPCPICGGQPDFQHFNITPNVRGRIICACGIELRQGENDTEDDMRIIWNTRSDYAVQAANERNAEQAIGMTLGIDRDEIYNAGFDNGVKACLQILDGYLEYPHSAAENIQKWVDEQWEEYGA